MTAVDLAGATEALAAEDAFRVCIHRGTQQIGGTCIELACEGGRILLDLGLPLDAGDTDPATLLPDVPGPSQAGSGSARPGGLSRPR